MRRIFAGGICVVAKKKPVKEYIKKKSKLYATAATERIWWSWFLFSLSPLTAAGMMKGTAT